MMRLKSLTRIGMEMEQRSSRNREPLHEGSKWRLTLDKLVSMFRSQFPCQYSLGVVIKPVCLEILDSTVKGMSWGFLHFVTVLTYFTRGISFYTQNKVNVLAKM